MGYTSRQLDEDMWYSDVDLILSLEGAKDEITMKKRAASIAMAFTTGEKSKGGKRRGR